MLKCKSDVYVTDASAMDKKGLIVDDMTLRWCPDRIPELWPNAAMQPISSIRMIRAWEPGWNDFPTALNNFVDFVLGNGVKVLVGTIVSCDGRVDQEYWEWTKELLKRLGPEHVMGVAVGNEVDRHYKLAKRRCGEKLWDDGFLWHQFTTRVEEIDRLGFGDVPVTNVFSSRSMHGGFPFVDLQGKARVKPFLENATRKYGQRYTFTFNINTFSEPDPELQLDEGSNDTCDEAMQRALCWESDCAGVKTMRSLRERVTTLTGREDSRLWIGKIGWASEPGNLTTSLRNCHSWASNESLETYYRGFLNWDLSLGGDVRPPDHVFYNSLRDAPSFIHKEYFGLMATCQSPFCKISTENITFRAVLYVEDMTYGLSLAFAGIAAVVCVMTAITTLMVKARRSEPEFEHDFEYQDGDGS